MTRLFNRRFRHYFMNILMYSISLNFAFGTLNGQMVVAMMEQYDDAV